MSRRERLKALDLDCVLILDRDNVELALPRDWTVAPDKFPVAYPLARIDAGDGGVLV